MMFIELRIVEILVEILASLRNGAWTYLAAQPGSQEPQLGSAPAARAARRSRAKRAAAPRNSPDQPSPDTSKCIKMSLTYVKYVYIYRVNIVKIYG